MYKLFVKTSFLRNYCLYGSSFPTTAVGLLKGMHSKTVYWHLLFHSIKSVASFLKFAGLQDMPPNLNTLMVLAYQVEMTVLQT